MKLNSWIQRGSVLTLVLVGMLAAPRFTNAQTQNGQPIERIRATSMNVTGAPEPLRIDLLRYSTEAEKNQMVTAFTSKGDKELANALKNGPNLGYIWTSETAGYIVRYAVKEAMPDGSERIVVATDHPLGSYNPYVWHAVSGQTSPANYDFAVLELRLDDRKPGEGKASVLAKVTADSKILALENYPSAPLVLKDVQRERSRYQPISDN